MKILKSFMLASLAVLGLSLASCGGGTSNNHNSEHHDHEGHDHSTHNHVEGEEEHCHTEDENATYDATILDENIAYSACLDCNILDDRTMEVWGPKNVCKMAGRPLVMFVPGKSGIAMEEFIRPYAENGYVVAVPKCANIKNEAKNDKTVEGLRCGVNDLTDAIKKMKLNYEKYGIDTTQIFLSGYGSGAEVVLNYCYVTGLYKDVDLNGIRGILVMGPNAAINFDRLEKNDDCTVKSHIVIVDNDEKSIVNAGNELNRQMGELSTLQVLPSVDDYNALATFTDSLKAISKRFVRENLKK